MIPFETIITVNKNDIDDLNHVNNVTYVQWVKKYSGATCTRVVEISNNQSNALLAKSETKWCLMNAQTKRPARITTEISDLFM